MNDSERIQKEKSLAENWEQIAGYKDQLNKSITQKDIGPLDLILLYRCGMVAAQHMEVHEEEIANTPDIEIRDKDSFLDSAAEKMGYILMLEDKTIPYNERLEAASNVKKCAWRGLYNDKEDIINFYNQPLDAAGSENMILMLKCAYAVLLELGIRELELSILEDMYNI